ncbi:MAG: hypothetical protein QY305_06110 [Candidatus Brocadiaceae baterium WH-1]|nr:MAG: hypothetical protein QY305_06110 [Candidatus Jettenia sp. AMX2]
MWGGHCPPNKTVSVIARSEAKKQSHSHGEEIASGFVFAMTVLQERITSGFCTSLRTPRDDDVLG